MLAIFRNRVSAGFDENVRLEEVPIPEERYGLIFVFRVFDRVSYALVLDSSKGVVIGDSARNP